MKNLGTPTGIPLDGGNFATAINVDVKNRCNLGVYSHTRVIARYVVARVAPRMEYRVGVALIDGLRDQCFADRSPDMGGKVPIRFAHLLPPEVNPLRNSTTSPSCITYSLPSMRTLPAAFASAMDPAAMRSS